MNSMNSMMLNILIVYAILVFAVNGQQILDPKDQVLLQTNEQLEQLQKNPLLYQFQVKKSQGQLRQPHSYISSNVREYLEHPQKLLAQLIEPMKQPPFVRKLVQDNEKINISGAGASFPFRLYSSAIFAYRFVNSDVSINYTSMGSTKGKCRMVGNCKPDDTKQPVKIDFAGSDTILGASDYSKADLQMFPAVAGAVVPIYKLDGISDLKLTAEVVAKIFNGEVTKWNDAEIQNLNNGVVLPNEEIIPVVRADGSGTTTIFKNALSDIRQQFKEGLPDIDNDTLWNPILDATIVKRESNSGVAGYVQSNKNTIGYSVLGEALAINLDTIIIVRVDDQGRIFSEVEASADSVEFALMEQGLDFGNIESDPFKEHLTADIFNAKGNQAWPFVGYTYFILPKSKKESEGDSCQKLSAVVEFVNWFYVDEVPQTIAKQLGYAPLPENVRRIVLKTLREKILCKGKPVYQSPQDIFPHLRVAGTAAMKSTMSLLMNSYKASSPITIVEEYQSATRDVALDWLNSDDLERQQTVMIVPDVQLDETILKNENIIALPLAAISTGFIYNLCGAVSNCIYENIPINLSFLDLKAILTSQTDLYWQDYSPQVKEIEDGFNDNEKLKIEIFFLAENSRDEIDVYWNSFIETVSRVIQFNMADIQLDRFTPVESTQENIRSAVYANAGAFAFNTFTSTLNGELAKVVALKLNTDIVLPTLDNIRNNIEFQLGNLNQNQFLNPSFKVDQLVNKGLYPFINIIYTVAKREFTQSQHGVPISPGLYASDKFTDLPVCGDGEAGIRFIGWMYGKNLDQDRSSAVDEPFQSINVVPVATSEDATVNETFFRFLEAFTCELADVNREEQVISILVPNEDKNFISTGTIAFGYVMFGISCFMTLSLSFWVHINRNKRMISVASPPFLQQILYGSIVSMSTIIPMSLQEFNFDGDFDAMSRTCKIQPFLYSIGFTIVFSALWLKTWRLNKIFNNPKLKNRFITNKRLMLYQAILLLLVVGLNLFWLFQDPLRYERLPVTESNPLVTYGQCVSNSPLTSYVPLAVVMALSIIYGNWITYQSRHVPSEFGEGKFLAVAMVSNLEALLIGIPILFVAGSNPAASYIVKVSIITFCNLGTVVIMFVPKIILAYGIGVVKNSSVMRSITAHATTSDNEEWVYRRRNTDGRKPQAQGSLVSLHSTFDALDTESRRSVRSPEYIRRSILV